MTPADVGEPVWLDLDVPRAPSETERRLLATLSAGVGEPLLHDQVAAVVIDAVCRCGCSSVRLGSDAPPVPAARVAQLSTTGRDDYFAVEILGSGGGRWSVNVALHVMGGRVAELEIFDSEGGEGVVVSAERLTDLDEPTLL